MNFNEAFIFSLIMSVVLIVFYFKYPRYYVEKHSKQTQSLYAQGNADAKKGISPRNINKIYMEGYSDAIKVAQYEKIEKTNNQGKH